MVSCILAFLAGQLLSAWVRVGTWPMVVVALVGSLVSLWWTRAAGLARACVVLLFGIWLAGATATPDASRCFLPDELAAKQWIEAEVEDVIGDPAEGLRVRVRARLAQSEGPVVCGRVLLSLAPRSIEPAVGETWRLHARLRRARSFANPRGYDAAGALARRGVWVTAFSTGRDAVRVAAAPGRWDVTMARARARIGLVIDGALPPRASSLLRALVIGDQSRIPDALRRTIADAGLAHLLSVSGLHIGIVWGLVFAATNWTLARSEWMLLHASVRAIAALSGVPAALGYAVLSGREVPAVRSVSMTALLAIGLCANREAEPLRVLVLAAGWIALLRPGSPLDLSFQLSFASVLALVLVSGAWAARRERSRPLVPPSPRQRIREHAAFALAASAAAMAGTAPLVALHFDRANPIGLLTNPILVPLAGTPATVLGLAGALLSPFSERAASGVFALARWPLEVLCRGAEIAVRVPYAAVAVPRPTLLEVALLYGACALPWLPHARRRAAALLLVTLAMLDAGFWVRERTASPQLRVRILDVGQGDASVIELPGGRVLVVDGGGFGRSRFDVGERVVLPYLRSRKILHVDVVVATHGDWDHQGGLHSLVRATRPAELWVPATAERARLAALEREVESGGGRVRALAAGMVPLEEGGVRVECLNPGIDAGESSNDASIVLRVAFGRTALLFTGDVEAAGERAFTARASDDGIDLLKVPHHGSATSSGEALVAWARPRVAVISAGSGNAYGFPDADVVERYRRAGTRVLRTDRDGSVAAIGDGETLRVRPWSEASAPLCSLFGALC